MISRHHYRVNSNLYYYKVGSYKAEEATLLKILINELGEDNLKNILSTYEKNEWGESVCERKEQHKP